MLIDAFDSHYIVPELGPDVKFSYASHKAVVEFKEAKAVSVTATFLFLLVTVLLMRPYR